MPLGILLGGILSATLIFVALWEPLKARLAFVGGSFAGELDLIGMRLSGEELGMRLLACVAGAWILLIALTRPGPVVGALELVGLAGFAVFGTRVYLRVQLARRVRRFGDQLETVLRMLASAVRVGLGVRQSLVSVADQSEEPARRELTRVVAAANVGLDLADALDDLAKRMPTHETAMMARTMRVQAQTGSDLASILDGLADAIRDRRRFYRKVAAMTAEARATAWLLGIIPLAIGAFVLVTMPEMRAEWLSSAFGRTMSLLAVGMDALAIVILLNMARLGE